MIVYCKKCKIIGSIKVIISRYIKMFNASAIASLGNISHVVPIEKMALSFFGDGTRLKNYSLKFF